MFAHAGFRNAAPRFPERISVHLPKGMRSAMARAAEEKGVSPPELGRRALLKELSEMAKSAGA